MVRAHPFKSYNIKIDQLVEVQSNFMLFNHYSTFSYKFSSGELMVDHPRWSNLNLSVSFEIWPERFFGRLEYILKVSRALTTCSTRYSRGLFLQ